MNEKGRLVSVRPEIEIGHSPILQIRKEQFFARSSRSGEEMGSKKWKV